MKEKKDIVKSIVVLFVICLVVSAALAVVNSFTAPVSAANATERENEARRAVIPDAAEFKAVDAALPDGVVSAYEGVDAGGATLGYVFTVEGKGFDGTISVMVRHRHGRRDSAREYIGCIQRDKNARRQDREPRIHRSVYRTGCESCRCERDFGATITSTAYRGCVETAFAAFETIKEAGK